LAEDGENEPGVAVQGNDRRLKDASTAARGIVELAEDGEDAPGVAVQGNDRRLKDASTAAKGIVELAEDGEDAPEVAVQGNDRRLKDATTVAKGIVELAEDGESAPGVAVQGNDRRLRDATTAAKGIVELAEDGEDTPGVAVQGNDRRLKDATERDPGIVTLAKDGQSKKGSVVQSTDGRLSDARTPLPHEHDYAPVGHEFNSHSGTISVRGARSESFTGITPPSDDSTIIFAKNEASDSGSIGCAGIAGISTQKEIRSYGIVGHSSHIGVRGQSPGGTGDSPRGCGVMGVSRFGAGGVFSSEHDYALVADGYGALDRYDDSVKLEGKGEALLVRGASLFQGAVTLRQDVRGDGDALPANLVELFELDNEEYIAAGDLLVVAAGGKSVLSRSRTEYNPAVIGVVSGNPAIVIDSRGEKKNHYPVVLAGTALCRIDAQKKPLRPGDPVVTSGTPGCGMSGAIDSFEKIGTVIGKALDGLDSGIGLVPVFIAHR
ncbi:MAG: carbohydrate-binding protein, partial [Spirochaetes bacterium]|nr:carbohydrate-binding protein [Spirochaetota bacterium]